MNRQLGCLPVILLALGAVTGGAARAEGSEPHPLARAQQGSVNRFSDGFEDTATLDDLFPRDRSRWDGVQREPAESTIELSSEVVRSGTRALRFTAVASTGVAVPKADVFRGSFRFKKGDHVWFSGWYYVVGGTDARHVFLWDLEDSRVSNNPGRRLYLQEGEHLASDLAKWRGGPKFRQTLGGEIRIPKDRWVHIKIHLLLSDEDDGRMVVWQDGVKVIDGRGRTLPEATSVYDRLQVGLTANGGNERQTLYIDDIVISSDEGDVQP